MNEYFVSCKIVGCTKRCFKKKGARMSIDAGEYIIIIIYNKVNVDSF